MKNETGKKYGKLTVLQYVRQDKNCNAVFLCLCDCGMTTEVTGNRLRSGKTKSCGCLITETARKMGEKYAAQSSARLKEFNKTAEHRAQASQAATKHGGTNEKLFRMWSRMRDRCNSPNSDHARWYHDKGIRVCDEWNDYATFREWAYANGYSDPPEGQPFKDRISIDRIDPQKGYSPDNCRFVSVSENSKLRNEYYANQR